MRKRSKYKPKIVRPDVMGWLMSGMLKAKDVGGGGIVLNTMIKNHNAVDVLRQGKAVKDDVSTIVEAINVTEALVIKHGIGDEYRQEISAAQDAIVEMCKRCASRGRFVLTGPELTAINVAMEIHDAQLDICTVSELEDAINYVWEQIRTKKTKVLLSPST